MACVVFCKIHDTVDGDLSFIVRCAWKESTFFYVRVRGARQSCGCLPLRRGTEKATNWPVQSVRKSCPSHFLYMRRGQNASVTLVMHLLVWRGIFQEIPNNSLDWGFLFFNMRDLSYPLTSVTKMILLMHKSCCLKWGRFSSIALFVCLCIGLDISQ